MSEKEEVEITELEPVDIEKPMIIEGIPDVGLAGTIAVSHLLDQIEFKHIGTVESDLLPPVMVIHDSKPVHPVRLYSRDNLILLFSEIAIPPVAINPFTKTLVNWFREQNADLVISLSGIPTQNRMDIEELSGFGVGNDDEARGMLKRNEIEFLEEGFISGVYALMLRECTKNNISALSILAQCFPAYPDPGAAAEVLKLLDRILNLGIDVEELLRKSDEVKIKARDLMKQTKSSIADMQKGMESEVPMMYG